ncbi:hypothetical protein Pelo_7780 [Pelomyxa schiedti]|nr:hypothetical protein Pelo_7780 [Pelomyxa schiedti]
MPTATVTASNVVIDARSQFVAFASSGIERCGVGSPARSLSHNRDLCESFGRDWVVGCCRQLGTTVSFPVAAGTGTPTDGTDPEARSVQVHMFMGVSATLGVVWCTWLDEGSSMLRDIEACVGENRFVASSYEGSAVIVDRNGRTVATLDGEQQRDPLGFWVVNSKWLVWIQYDVDSESKLIVWRMGNGLPVSDGVGVQGTALKNCAGGGFSPFEPFGDELLIVGCSDRARVSFVDLEKSIESGGTVESKRRVCLPYGDAFDLLWSSPTTIVTLHCLSGTYKVYNTVTGELVHTFPSEKYKNVYVLPHAHITALRSSCSICEVYSCASSIWAQQPSFAIFKQHYAHHSRRPDRQTNGRSKANNPPSAIASCWILRKIERDQTTRPSTPQ